jgi:hypothetical protein
MPVGAPAARSGVDFDIAGQYAPAGGDDGLAKVSPAAVVQTPRVKHFDRPILNSMKVVPAVTGLPHPQHAIFIQPRLRAVGRRYSFRHNKTTNGPGRVIFLREVAGVSPVAAHGRQGENRVIVTRIARDAHSLVAAAHFEINFPFTELGDGNQRFSG